MEQESSAGARIRSAAPLTLAEQVRLAEARGWQMAYDSHRAHVFSQRGVPVFATRGRGDCLALVLLPFGLILLAVHPLPAILMLLVIGWLYLSGSERLRQERQAIAAAENEALRLWLEVGHPPPAAGLAGAVPGGTPGRISRISRRLRRAGSPLR